MGHTARYAAALLSGVALGVLSAGAAHAQQAPNTNTKYVTLLERLVIGAGAPKVAIDTPQAVTVIDQADIDAKQAGTIGEILSDTPGVTMIGSQRPLGESFNIRGVGAAETSGDEARIILTVDGAKKFYEQYRMGSFFSDPELYKRVEVLRGPASSTLYGSGAMGGVVNFTTKDASDFIQDGQTGALRLKSTYTSNGNGALASAVLAHRINETFEVLATGNFRRSDVQELANGGALSGTQFQAWSGLLKGTMYLDNDETIRVSYQRWNSDTDKLEYWQTGSTGFPLSNPQNFGLIDRTVDDQTAVISYENRADDNDMLDLKVQLSYSDTLVKQDNSTYAFVATNNFLTADYGYKTVQLNVQNTSEFGGDNWTNFLTYGFQTSQQQRTAVPEIGTLVTTHPEGTATSFGMFAQSEHTINDAFTVIVGARGDYSRLDPSVNVLGAQRNEQFGFSPKVAALYRFNENFNVFGSVAHTERLPTIDEVYQYQPTAQNGQPSRAGSPNLGKEQSNNYEIGFATQGYDLFGLENSVAFKATAFYNDITDGIRLNPTAVNGQPYFLNIAGIRLWGLELEGSYESEVAFARLAYTLTRGEYSRTISATVPAGTPVDSLPQDKVVLTVGGRLPEQNVEFGTKITAAADPTVWVNTQPNTGKPWGWTSVDVFTNWKPEQGPLAGIEAQFSVENVFNTDYRESLSPDRSKGRTFKLTLAKQFDY